MSEQKPSEEQVVKAIYALAAEEMKKGASEQQIKATLVEKGLDEQTAGTVVANLNKMRTKAKSGVANRRMLFGALWFIGGLAVTAITYGAASGGGSYVVAWGAMLYGAIQFIRGLWQAVSG